MPSVPSKKIYLIPVGLDPSESLDWAPSYYKAKLGIEVEVLPATDIPSDLTDPKRKQVDSERLVEHLCRSYSEICHDPGNTLIGVTSRDIFIRSFGWRYAENFRNNGRFAIVSSARFHPFSPFSGWNPEWFGSRLQKILTKNIVVLYFDLPLSRDYTSLLSGGQLSGHQVDMMSGSIIGDSGTWDPFLESDDIQLTMYSVPDKPLVWRMTGSHEIFPQTSARIFEADLTLGLFGYRKTDFHFDGDYPLQFTRAYRNLDEHSRPFGIGANDSLDIFLVGQMGAYIDLIFEDGSRIHFDHAPLRQIKRAIPTRRSLPEETPFPDPGQPTPLEGGRLKEVMAGNFIFHTRRMLWVQTLQSSLASAILRGEIMKWFAIKMATFCQ